MNSYYEEDSIFFSIVIPLYNKEKHIRRTIYSVLSQTHKNFEIIVVDDGSTDNSFSEVKKIEDHRIRLVRQDNKGVSCARNKGIKLAKYEYLGFIDADDVWGNDFLKAISQLIIAYPNAGAYGTAYKFIKAGRKEIVPKSISGFEKNWTGLLDDYFKYALISPIITASSVVIPRTIFNELGFFRDDISRGEDLEMWCKIALKYKIAFDSQIHAIYYIDSDNRASKTKPIIEKTFSYFADDILRTYKKERNATFYFEMYMKQKIINKALLYAKSNNRIEARKILKTYKLNKYNWKPYLKTVVKLLISNHLK